MTSPSPSSGIVLFAKDIAHTARFYQALLALAVVHSDKDHIVLESADAALVIHGIPAHIASQIDIASPPELREETPLKPFYRVASLQQARQAAAAHGGAVAPDSKQWAARDFLACDGYDPEGNVFQLRQNAVGFDG
jgi:predicted enzyme related to lactoylglutathione lyase